MQGLLLLLIISPIPFLTPVIDCGPPAQVPNAWLPLVRNTTHTSEIRYHCKPGYRNEGGNSISVCSVTGRWEGAALICKEINCGNPPTIPNAVLIWNHSSKLGSAVQYTCQDGFVSVSGKNVSVCTEGGRWKEVTLLCKGNHILKLNTSRRDRMQSISKDTYLVRASKLILVFATRYFLFQFQVWGKRIYQRDFFTAELFNYTTADISPAVCLDLQPGTNYTVNITAFTEQLSASVQISTKISVSVTFLNKTSCTSAPPVPDVEIVVVERLLPPLILRRVEEKNGPISLYQVLVLPLHFQHTFTCNSLNISGFFGPNRDSEGYVTAEFVAMDVEDGMEFSVGDRLYYRAYYNAPLEAGKNYSFLLKVISEWGYVS
uniref:Sushi domain-containing protein n=1 Tax=Callorhinchus milii TaxID=7868 RepID=A0A4W3HYT4_CALMI